MNWEEKYLKPELNRIYIRDMKQMRGCWDISEVDMWHLTYECCCREADMVRQFDIWTEGMTRGMFTWNDPIVKRITWCRNSHHVRPSSLSNKINQLLLIPWGIVINKKQRLGRWTTGGQIVWPFVHTTLPLLRSAAAAAALRTSKSRSLHDRMITLDRKPFTLL